MGKKLALHTVKPGSILYIPCSHFLEYYQEYSLRSEPGVSLEHLRINIVYTCMIVRSLHKFYLMLSL